ncbi:MAG TPA: HEAT repeat domain-containing protein [Vicinamibacterales bacterium]|nr:HEAT repeat domain-containing protein [Vicinamibacterales bacterium]
MPRFAGSIAVVLFGFALLAAPSSAAVREPDSQRLEQAKDFIADEQWIRAIDVLRRAAADAKERNKDEALFWLAHSLHQARDLGRAVETISELERKFPTSRWVKPARSLRVEIAQKLQRDDVLWWTARPPALVNPTAAKPLPAARAPRATTPAAPVVPPAPSEPGMAVPPAPGATTPRPATVFRTAPPAPSSAEAPRTVETPRGRPMAFSTPAPIAPATAPPMMWIPQNWDPDTDLRIQALGSLMRTDSARVIPMLKEIALDSPNPQEASRAVFVLAQSGHADAHSTVIEVAMHGSEPVRVAAVRELGRFGGAKVPEELLQVYSTGNTRVKYQVVNSLGERAATVALMQIAESESNQHLRDTAIVTLGQAGGRAQLQRLYMRASAASKRPIIAGLFNARAENELIQIAERETDPAIRQDILARLRLLGTPKAKAYVEKAHTSR